VSVKLVLLPPVTVAEPGLIVPLVPAVAVTVKLPAPPLLPQAAKPR